MVRSAKVGASGPALGVRLVLRTRVPNSAIRVAKLCAGVPSSSARRSPWPALPWSVWPVRRGCARPWPAGRCRRTSTRARPRAGATRQGEQAQEDVRSHPIGGAQVARRTQRQRGGGDVPADALRRQQDDRGAAVPGFGIRPGASAGKEAEGGVARARIRSPREVAVGEGLILRGVGPSSFLRGIPKRKHWPRPIGTRGWLALRIASVRLRMPLKRQRVQGSASFAATSDCRNTATLGDARPAPDVIVAHCAIRRHDSAYVWVAVAKPFDFK